MLIWWLTHRGIQLSARIATILGALEVLIMLALGITLLLHPGKGSSYVAPLTPAMAPNHFRGILAGMMFSVLALAGFESPAPLAREARLPGKSIGQAVMLSLISIGIFYFFMSYASAVGWGTGDMASFANSANPYYALGHSLWGAAWWLVIFALINCAVAVGIACTNSASRVRYTMGRASTLPASFGRIHPVHLTPAVAIGAAQIVGMISILLVGFLLRPDYIFNFPGTVATLAVIINLCHGKPGADAIHAARAARSFPNLAAYTGCVGCDLSSAAGLFCNRVPGAAVALQPRSVRLFDLNDRGPGLHVLA